MNIPPEAIQAATEAMLNQPNADLGITLSLPGCKGMSIPDGYAHLATAALEAALPHIRKQIAADIRAEMNQPRLIELADRHEGYYQGQRTGLERAARIAEEGTTK